MRLRPLLTVLLAVEVLAACGGAPAAPAGSAATALPAVLRVGLIPNIAPERQRAAYAPFSDALGRALGVEVELFVAPSYAGVVTALAAGKLDVAYLGGLTYVQAEQQVPLTPLVTEVDQQTRTPRTYRRSSCRSRPARGAWPTWCGPAAPSPSATPGRRPARSTRA